MSSSTLHSRAFVSLSAAVGSARARWSSRAAAVRKAASSRATFASCVEFSMRSDLISRIEILSISSPTETGTTMSLMRNQAPLRSFRRGGTFERAQERPEMLLIGAPAADCALVDRPADLRGAGGADRPLGGVEGEATLFPRQAAIRDDAPRLPLQIRHHVLVADVEQASLGQDPSPMPHELRVALVIAPELREVVGVILLGRE